MTALSIRIASNDSAVNGAKMTKWEEMVSHVLVMGICGTGKSSVARGLSDRTGRPFIEADDHHSDAAVRRMARGEALTDEDRWGWLDRISEAAASAGAETVIACSALKRAYRRKLEDRLGSLTIIHLAGPRLLIAERMEGRDDHFMPTSLIETQLADLEDPAGEGAITLDIDRPLGDLIAAAERIATGSRASA